MTDVSDIFPDHTRGVHVESCYAFTGTRDHTFNKNNRRSLRACAGVES